MQHNFLWGEKMKPLVVYMTDKEITITKEEFEKFLTDAYNAGHTDGYNKGYASGKSYGWWNNPVTIPSITYTDKTPYQPYDPYKITCNSGEVSNAIGD